MTHRYKAPNGISLSNFSAHAEINGYQLLCRVVSLNDSACLTFPIRELWVSTQIEEDIISYLLYTADSPETCEERNITLEEANDCLASCRPWLRYLESESPTTIALAGGWYVTAVVKADLPIWTLTKNQSAEDCYVIREEATLRKWLDDGIGGAQRFNDESDWWCRTHNESDSDNSGAAKANQQKEEEIQDVVVPVDLSRWLEEIGNPSNYSLVRCEQLSSDDDGYDGDTEPDSALIQHGVSIVTHRFSALDAVF